MSGHEVLLSIAGGVALLLWVTRMVRTGIMRAYGPELRRLIGQTTRTRLSAFAVGLGFPGEDGEVVLIGPDRKVPDGGRMY